MPFGPPLELDGLSPGDRARAERFNHFREHEAGYLHIQATRPSTLAYGLTDSPAAQLAWIADRMPEAAVGRDRLLLTASLYWFTGSGATSAHGTYDGMKAWREIAGAPFDPPPMPPKAVAVFGDDTTIRCADAGRGRALDGVRHGRPLRGPGDARVAARRPARVLRLAALSIVAGS